MNSLKETAVALLLLIVLAFLVFRIVGCTPAELPEAAAGAGYAAQQLACVDTYADKHNIDACRAKVRAAWGVDGGAR